MSALNTSVMSTGELCALALLCRRYAGAHSAEDALYLLEAGDISLEHSSALRWYFHLMGIIMGQ